MFSSRSCEKRACFLSAFVFLVFPLLLVLANSFYVAADNRHFRKGFFIETALVAGWLLLLGWRDKEFCLPKVSWEKSIGISVLTLTLITVVTRFYLLDVFPGTEGSIVEESQTGGLALGGIQRGVLDSNFPLTDLLGEAGLLIFGRTMTGLRLPFVIWSCLAVAFFYMACRIFYQSRWTAMLMVLLFASNAYVMAAGRIAMETLAPLTTVTLTLAFILRAWKRDSIFSYALAGALNGLLFIEYFAFRFIGVLNCLWILLLVAQKGKEERPEKGVFRPALSSWYGHREYLLIFFVMLAAVALPCWLELGREGTANLLEGVNRQFVHNVVADSENLPTAHIFTEACGRIFAQFRHLLFDSTMPVVIIDSRGIFDFATGLLWIAAALFTLFSGWRNPLRVFPLFATLATVVLAAVLTPVPLRYRIFCVVPYFLLTLGLPLDVLLSQLKGRPRLWTIYAASLLAGALSVFNVQDFFGKTIHDGRVRDMSYDFALVVAHELKRQQLQHPEEKLSLLSFDLVDGDGGDVRFIYDWEKVRFASSLDEISGPSLIVACNDFADEVAGSNRFEILKTWKHSIQKDRYVVARTK